eukprot:8284685-Karenia_brevis.AAC.1
MPTLNAQQSEDQAGFRPKFRTTDHLFELSCMEEKAHEFQHNSYIAAIDYTNAFDAVEHAPL